MMTDADARAKRRELSAERSRALAAGDIARFQELNRQILALPMKGVPMPTAADMARWNRKHK